jgi:quercetin dioxygenase-like cupin family protein
MINSSLLVTVALLAAAPTAGQAGGQAGQGENEERRIAEAIERALQRHAPDVHRCFEKSLADRLDSAGKVEVEVEVGQAGQVTGARLLNQAGEVPPELSACVREAAKGWRLEGVEPGAAVVLPFSFEGQAQQFVVKVADVPERGPGSAKGRAAPAASFTVKVLVDPVNTRNPHAALTLLTLKPARRVAMHRHPKSAKILYLLKGKARVLGPPGVPPIRAEEGTAIFLPEAYPHVIENTARQAEATFLQIFSPAGPERVYRDPKDAEARTLFEVLRDPRVKAPPGVKPVMATWERPATFAGKGRAHVLISQQTTGNPALALSVLELGPGVTLPRHSHGGTSEILYVLEGGGKLTVGSETTPFGPATAMYLPPDQPHDLKLAGGGHTVILQIFSPAGAEQDLSRPRTANPPASK